MVEIRSYTPEILDTPAKIAYVFPGQGSQYTGMGREIIDQSHIAQSVFKRADECLEIGITDICINNHNGELQQTKYAQPAIYTHSMALFAMLHHEGLAPDYVAGHSMGEIPAYVAAGGLSFEDGLSVIAKRAELMERAGNNNPGAMGVIVGADLEEIRDEVEGSGAYVANINAPDQIVLSGHKDAIMEMVKNFSKKNGANGKRIYAKALDVSIAAHSPLMESEREEFRDFLQKIDFKIPSVPIILNRTNDISTDPEVIRNSFADQLTQGVNWVEIQKRLKLLGVDAVLEIGPGNVLTKLAEKSVFADSKERILSSDKISGFSALLQILRT